MPALPAWPLTPAPGSADTSFEGSMEHKRPPNLRRSGQPDAESPVADDSSLRAPFPVNETAELVADLIAATDLLPADKLALVRGRATQGGTLAQAILEEGVASPDGIARTLASRF